MYDRYRPTAGADTQRFKQIQDQADTNMGIQTPSEYIDFFLNLNMGEDASLLSFLNNEKLTLKQKLRYKNQEKEPIKKGIEILEGLAEEVGRIGRKAVLEKYRR